MAVAQQTLSSTSAVIRGPRVSGPQFEIEAQYIKISADDMKQLGISPLPRNAAEGPFTRATVPVDIQAGIAQFVSQNKAKVQMAPRLTTVFDLPASLRSVTMTPIAWGLSGGGEEKYYDDASLISRNDYDYLRTKTSVLYLGLGLGIDAMLKRNDDNTLTLVLSPGRMLQLQRSTKANGMSWNEMPWKRNLDGTQTIPNIKDGEIVALLADSRLVMGLSSKPQKPSNLLLLVKTTLIRSSG